ncbi:calcitonin gene-related peptide type 1 receptor-like isoform X2 [Varroa destructor]|uniref:Uncharacterized protein n=1 Tax=Varroa destructor TaxID=109461 RepID=A0A7M7JSK1_VARDE|nr:calcitonin gene-related peptide type 1 receptor-like isoform X2 [Varroa destructor]
MYVFVSSLSVSALRPRRRDRIVSSRRRRVRSSGLPFIKFGTTFFFLNLALFSVELTIVEAVLSSNITGTCRLETGARLPIDDFIKVTAARCYRYMHEKSFVPDTRLTFCGDRLCDGACQNSTLCYEHRGIEAVKSSNESGLVYNTFAQSFNALKWEGCAQEAQKCCLEQLATSMANNLGSSKDGLFCPATWDGWSCWKDTANGTTVSQFCHDHVYQLTKKSFCEKKSHKTCEADGFWQKRQGREYTVYNCGTAEHRHLEVYLSIYLHSLSAVLLLPTLVIFSLYKQLRVIRILLHKNVCISLLLHGLATITKDYIFTMSRVSKTNPIPLDPAATLWLCRSLTLIIKYLRMCQYAWMFCEGFYLHKILVTAFKEQKSMLPFYAFGWVMPAFFLIIYGSMVYRGKNTSDCEVTGGWLEWAHMAPSLLCLVCNFFFLTNIMRVLVSKLRSSHGQEPIQFRKAARAVMILFPLFGMHFLLGLYRVPDYCGGLTLYAYYSKASDGLQGTFVAFLFCYLNGEVHHLLKRSYGRYVLRRGINSGRGVRLTARMSFSTHVSSVAETNVRCCDVTKPLTQPNPHKINDTNC